MLSVRLPLFPTLRVHVHSNFSHELTRQVISGELDVAIIAAGHGTSRLNFLELTSYPLFALMGTWEPAARKRSTCLEDFDDRVWVFISKHVHPVLHDSLLRRAEELGIVPREIQLVTTAEEAAYLVVKHQGIAFLGRTGAWRVARNELTMRPLDEAGLIVKTTLITRSDDRTRLTSEYVRADMRKLQPTSDSNQRTLPLVG
jgi:DNA-binding transcriptional LysR family regulator